MKNIHVLPTRLASEYYITKEGKLEESYSLSRGGAVHFYITNDEEIKDVRPHKGKWQLEKGQILNQFPDYLTDLSECKLVIMTTDPQLIADGIQAIDDEFLEWFVKNPSCGYVEVESGLYFYAEGEDRRYKIIIPKEEPKQETLEENCCTPVGQIKRYVDCKGCDRKPKQETLEEAAEKYASKIWDYSDSNEKTLHANCKKAFIKSAKWQQEQIGKSEFLQKLRATLSDAEARRLIFETFKNK